MTITAKKTLYTGLGASAVAHIVDKNGVLVVSASLKGVDSAEVENLLSVGLVDTNVGRLIGGSRPRGLRHGLSTIPRRIASRTASVFEHTWSLS